LVEKLANENHLTYAVAETIIIEMIKCMADTLISGNRIEIRGFGSFEIRENGAYAARNPKSGIQIEVKPNKSPFFKTGKDLMERLLLSEISLIQIL